MKFEYRYVVAGDTSITEARLNEILEQGWRPVRETACPITAGQAFVGSAAWLVLLEREKSADDG